MTAADKQGLANFLDTAGDYLSSGYHNAPRNYQFDDDTVTSPAACSNVSRADSGVPNSSLSPHSPLEQIAAEIRACKNCPLSATRTNAAPGEGVTRPLVMVIGEGPGRDEDEQGRPFVGRAGQLLDKMLSSIDLSRTTNCFIANVVKCRPPNNRDPYPEETAACAHFLDRQITLLKPEFILVAGRIAAQTLLKTNDPIGKLRGKFSDYETAEGTIPLLVTYHPAALLRNEDYKRPAWEDLKSLRSRIDSRQKSNGGN